MKRLSLLACLILAACASAPAAREPGLTLIPGAFTPGRQPDGNTAILEASGGLIVFDTGRHAEHAQKIIDAARARGLPVTAIINSHWHLDHVSGNIALKQAFPAVRVHSHGAALDEALGGFLARGAESNRRMIAEGKAPEGQLADARTDLATVEQGPLLKPDVSVESSRTLRIGGRDLELNVVSAASAGDIWVWDSRSRTVLAGDLITFPAPFLDTACPREWDRALEAILARPFEQLIPGHGQPMQRPEVMGYRGAFRALVDCAAGRARAEACAGEWTDLVIHVSKGSADPVAARQYAAYYVENVMRKPGALPAGCLGLDSPS